MASEVKVTDNILTAALEKWGNKGWFQGLFIGVVIYLLLAPIASPIISSHFTKQNTTDAVTETLEERDKKIREDHVIKFEQARQAYTLVKKEMNKYLEKIDCDYIFLIEYHNGTENVMTGIQFCKFDMTLECTSPAAPYIPLEKFHDDLVARYDLLLNDEFAKTGFMFVNAQDFEKVDRYLAYQMQYANAKSFAIINLKDTDQRVFGAFLCLNTKKSPMDLVEIYKLADSTEKIFAKNKTRLYE